MQATPYPSMAYIATDFLAGETCDEYRRRHARPLTFSQRLRARIARVGR